MNSANTSAKYANYLAAFFRALAILVLFGMLIILPYSAAWLYQSGDLAVERAVAAQAQGKFAIFGSGISQDFVDYKLQLYDKIRPEIVAIGSSRVMQFRGAWFTKKFLNMGGVAGNLAALRSTINAMLKISRPNVMIMGLDFWWFMPQWEPEPQKDVPPTSGSYAWSFNNLKKPWEWLVEGKISLKELMAPILGIFGRGFSADQYGIMAQQTRDGFGPDGSWYYTAESTGLKKAFDYLFSDTLECISRGIKAFYHATPEQAGPSRTHIEAFADIWCKLKSRGVEVYLFIPPIAPQVLRKMGQMEYPHLYKLRERLLACGIPVMDFSDLGRYGATDCEFIDGFHGGEVAYARILQAMADHWPGLLSWVNMEKLQEVIERWTGHALVANSMLTDAPETDFLGLGCIKHRVPFPQVKK